MLTRFNLTALAVVYVVYQLAIKKFGLAVREVSVAGLVALVIVSPWFVRNLIVFDGRALYSTHTGMNFLEGLVTPDGRIHGDDWDKLSSRCGYTLYDIEVNSETRLAFPSEPELDQKALSAAVAELARVNLFRLSLEKLSYFWLSFDQAFKRQDVELSKRVLRLAGVFIYWIFLAMGLRGWRKCKQRYPNVTLLFVICAIVVTCLHLPFVMSTRIRTPFVEPALAILVGCAFTSPVLAHEKAKQEIGT